MTFNEVTEQIRRLAKGRTWAVSMVGQLGGIFCAASIDDLAYTAPTWQEVVNKATAAEKAPTT